MRGCVLSLLAIVFAGGLHAEAIDISGIDRAFSPSDQMELLKTHGQSFDLNRAIADQTWEKVHGDFQAFGFTEDEVWVRFELKNSAAETRSIILEMRSPRTDRVEVYLFRQKGIEKSIAGDGGPGDGSALADRNPAFRISLSPSEKTPVYVRVKSQDPLEAAPFLMSERQYDKLLFRDCLLIGAYLGALMLLFCANGLLFLASRDKTFGIYALYLLTLVFLTAGLSGILYALTGSSHLVNEGSALLGFLTGLILVVFCREFLQTKIRMPRMDVLLRILFLLSIPIPILLFAFGYRASVIYIHIHGAIAALIVITVGAAAIRENLNQSRLFIVGWAALYGFLIVEALARALVIPHTEITGNGFMIGAMVESMIFSVALAFRMRQVVLARESEQIRVKTLDSEMELARRSQEALLPRFPPDIIGLQVQARYIPFFAVSGDFYAYHQIDSRRLGILVADVSGHGLSAALDSSVVRIAFHHAVGNFTDPADVLTAMNVFLHSYVEYRFVSAVYTVFDTNSGTVVSSSAGHPPPIICRSASRTAESIHTDGPLLGLAERPHYEKAQTRLDTGDRVILYTDGLYERFMMDHPEMDQEALLAIFAEYLEGPPDTMADRMLEGLARARAGPPTDDITLVIVHVGADKTASVVRV